MKEDLQGKLVEILASIQDATGKAADFALTELPDVAQQYITFGRVYETVTLVVVTLLFGLILWALIKMCLDFEPEAVGAFVVFSCIAIFTFVWWCKKLKAVMMVWLAPKVWLITELAKIVNPD